MDCPACHHPNVDGARFCAKCGAPLPAPAAPEADPLLGTIVGGRFRIVGILGEGGMGRVYSGEQQMGTSVRRVAVKTLLQQFAKDPQTHARFMRECGTVSELEHPNTIKVYDFGQTPTGELYIAMELLTGVSVEKELERGPITPERTERILGQVCGSLQEAHDKGIVHRDLKPANIQLSVRAGEEDYVKVLDFGIAKRGESKDAKQEQKLTQQGTILGTPPYMSPEQFTGKELDARSDIYSLGVIAYEMLTGRLPFDADTPWQWATQHMTAQPFPFETIPMAANVPPKMKAAVMRALHKDREQRQQIVREFFDELSVGGQRLSMLHARAPSASFPETAPAVSSGTAVISQQGRPGQTQMGEPLFQPGAAVPAGRTMVDQAAMPGPHIAAHGGAPTGGGQAFPTPPAAKKGGNTAAIVGVGAVVGVIAIVGLVFAMKGGKGGAGTGDESTGAGIPLPGSGPVTAVSADPIPTSTVPPIASGTPTVPVTATSPKITPTTPDKPDPGAAACEKAINQGNGGNIQMAVNSYSACTGPRRPAAAAAIGAGASTKVANQGCRAKADANAAASIGQNAARAALPATCRR